MRSACRRHCRRYIMRCTVHTAAPAEQHRRRVIMAISQNYYRYEYVVISLFGYFLVLFWFLCCWLPVADCRLLVRIKFIVYAQYTAEWVGRSVGRHREWDGRVPLNCYCCCCRCYYCVGTRQSCLERRCFFAFPFCVNAFAECVCVPPCLEQFEIFICELLGVFWREREGELWYFKTT